MPPRNGNSTILLASLVLFASHYDGIIQGGPGDWRKSPEPSKTDTQTASFAHLSLSLSLPRGPEITEGTVPTICTVLKTQSAFAFSSLTIQKLSACHKQVAAPVVEAGAR